MICLFFVISVFSLPITLENKGVVEDVQPSCTRMPMFILKPRFTTHTSSSMESHCCDQHCFAHALHSIVTSASLSEEGTF